MKGIKSRHSARGFSLLEVLIAVVILSVGLLAIAALQGRLLRNTGDTKARTMGLAIAQAQIDRFRNIEDITDDVSDGDNEFSFDEIITGSLGDGSEFADATMLGATAVDDTAIEFGGTSFSVQWQVANCVSTGVATFDCSGAALGDPDFKHVAVFVGWQDPTGEPREVMVEEYIPAVTPSDSAKVLDDNSDKVAPPLVGYYPQAAPEVIRVPTLGLGGDRFKETDKPEPKTIRGDFNELTTFSTVTFEGDGSGGFTALRREDFFMVNCSCEFAQSTDSLVGREPTYWNGEKYIVGDEDDTKMVGVPSVDRAQFEVCDICCRDHHDGTDQDALKYDPFRTLSGEDNGDHSHFVRETGGLVQAIPSLGNQYLEACRMVRVDGELKVAQDFQLVALNVMREDQLSSSISEYQEYVVAFIDHFLNNLPATDPDYPNNVTDDTVLLNDYFTGGLDTTIESNTNYQARGIYVDALNPALLDCIQKRQGNDNSVEPSYCTPATGNVLDITPFFEVNLTSLVNWADNGLVGSDGTYSPDADASALNLTATIEQSNTGFLPDTGPVATDDENEASETLVLTQAGRADGVWRLAGMIDVGRQADFATPAGVTITAVSALDGSNGMQCKKPVDNEFNCDITQSEVQPGTLTVKVGNYVKTGFNNQGDPVTQDNKVCYATDLTGVVATVVNAGQTTETTVFTFPSTNATDPNILDKVLDVDIRLGSRNCANGYIDSTVAVVAL